MVMAVGSICLTVAPSTCTISRGLAPWTRPPTKAARKIQTPGVLIQVKVTEDEVAP